jgi:Tfp pilus assembly protein PilE
MRIIGGKMSKRKLKFNCKISINNDKVENEYFYKNSGITLVALVITIIVMLILAGISLNTVIGNNGVITQAQNATFLTGMNALEEYLQEKYIEYYEDSENYTNKIEMLASKLPDLLLTTSSTRKYIVYEGQAYYILNKNSLPDEIKDGLSGGNSTQKADYTKLYDVYGVTTNLKVYYIDKKTDSKYGDVESSDIDPNTPATLLNNKANSALKNSIVTALNEIGVDVDESIGITSGNLSSLKTLTLDGQTSNITSLTALSEVTGLQELTLKNLTLNNLDGLESLSVLNYVYFYNCNIKDYTQLASVYKLKYLYFHFVNTMSESVTNNQIIALGEAFKNATGITDLQYLGFYGVNLNTSMTYPWWNTTDSGGFYNTYTSSTRSNLSDISGLANFSDNIKKSVKYLYLNNNKIVSISSLSGFTNITQIWTLCNSPLTSLSGLENHTSLTHIASQSCGLTDLQGLNGTTKLYILSVQGNSNLKSLSGIEKNTGLYSLLAYNCNFTDVTALSEIKDLQILYLNGNSNLQSVSAIASCTNLKRLYLANNNNMVVSEVALLSDIINKCGLNYSLPTKYLSAMTTLTSYDYANFGLTDTSTEFQTLKGRTNVTRLRISGNKALSNSAINDVLKTMTGLKYLSLTDLTNLTSIEFIKNLPNLIELDLRGTNVTSSTDIALLNTYGTKLVTLLINNSNIKIEDIEDTLITINKNFNANSLDSWISNSTGGARGAICLANYDFSKITKLTTWRVGQLNANGSYYFDLSNCTNLTYFYCYSNNKVKLPSSTTTVFSGNGTPTIDLSLCNKLTKYSAENTKAASVEAAITSLPDNNVLNNLYTYISSSSYTTLDFLGNFNASNLKTLTMIGYGQYSSGLKDIKGLQYAPNITSLDIHYTSVSSLDGIQYLKNLESLYAYTQFSKISDISYLSELTKLKTVNLAGNKISSIPDLSKLTQLTTLNLSTNYISDLKSLENLIINNNTSLRTLNLANNNIEEYTSSGVSNVQILKNLKTAGVTSITITGNNFSETPEI